MRNQQFKKDCNRHQTHPGYTATAFTMVEVIVALVILSTSLIAVFGAMRTCSGAAHHTRMLSKSVLLAESLLTEVKLNKNPVFETKKGQEDLYRWQVQIASTPVENLGAVCVQVKWQEKQRQQQYELFSLVHIESFIKGK